MENNINQVYRHELKEEFVRALRDKNKMPNVLWSFIKEEQCQVIFSHYTGELNTEHGYIYFDDKEKVYMFSYAEKDSNDDGYLYDFKLL